MHANGTTSFDDVKAILLKSEENMQFRIKNVVFADSFQILSASLNTLVATLRKSGKENFVETRKYMGDDDIVFEKGHFPYTYFDWTNWT